MLEDYLRTIGAVFGKLPCVTGVPVRQTGKIRGVSINAVADTLDITPKMVNDAKKEGCKTFEQIKDFWNLI